MTSPIPAADVKTTVELRYGADMLIDLTNQGKPDLIIINQLVLDQAIEDAERFFLDEVGDASDDVYAMDVYALPTCVIYILVKNVPLLDDYREYYLSQALDELEAASQYRENFPPESTKDEDKTFQQDYPTEIMPNPESSNNT